jgi:hypothetical protein
MGTVAVAIRIDERSEAWNLAIGHMRHAAMSQEVCHSARKMGHLKIIGRTRASPLEGGKFITLGPCKVKMTARFTA